ncbi:SAM-dependent methyltransferase [Saccharopolyspora sp. CA-218241]|uniref:SAM-dependent methyltransferase n=1 Tax=Saccharopolyspora sp. CA-218241 TaxID=3240027 RepID=UPI003D980BB2
MAREPVLPSPDLDGIDLDRPNAARMYDYYLGGAHNFAVDRALADEAIRAYPSLPAAAQANRSFLRRIVHLALARGITQFLDLGSGIPTVGNVHEIALRREPDARVAYVDHEAVAVAHSRHLLRDVVGATVTHADLRQVDEVCGAPGVREVLDLSRPVALLAIAVLHFVRDEDGPAELLREYRRRLAPGSLIALSHSTDVHLPDSARRAARAYRASANPIQLRHPDELRHWLAHAGTELLPPEVVDVARWREGRTEEAEPSGLYACLARVP